MSMGLVCAVCVRQGRVEQMQNNENTIMHACSVGAPAWRQSAGPHRRLRGRDVRRVRRMGHRGVHTFGQLLHLLAWCGGLALVEPGACIAAHCGVGGRVCVGVLTGGVEGPV
jgi:hypothetical protein